MSGCVLLSQKVNKMASVLRSSFWRLLSHQSRRYASTYAENLKAVEEHAASTMVLWKRISLFVALPMVGLVAYNSYKKEEEHHHHVEEHGRDPFIPYSHLRIRSKPFPWGDGNHTLIHNPRTNPLPDGYEDE